MNPQDCIDYINRNYVRMTEARRHLQMNHVNNAQYYLLRSNLFVTIGGCLFIRLEDLLALERAIEASGLAPLDYLRKTYMTKEAA
jgi:hypothetical protein